jgi:hypothetical protein
MPIEEAAAGKQLDTSLHGTGTFEPEWQLQIKRVSA